MARLVSAWIVQRLDELGADGGALLSITGNPEPELFGDLDGARVARSRMRAATEATLRLSNGLINWSVVAFPTEGWARAVFGEPDLDRLWTAVATLVRLDKPDPIAAWKHHLAALDVRAGALSDRRFDALRYRGPGTNLTVGLHRTATGSRPSTSRRAGSMRREHADREDTAPDARRVDGTVSATYPLQLQGNVIRNLRIRFEGGQAVEIHADERGLHPCLRGER